MKLSKAEDTPKKAIGKENTKLTTTVKKPVIMASEPDTTADDYEPLLAENKHRFVLFPIKWHEVCTPPSSNPLSRIAF